MVCEEALEQVVSLHILLQLELLKPIFFVHGYGGFELMLNR
jgi:hypothetical protein